MMTHNRIDIPRSLSDIASAPGVLGKGCFPLDVMWKFDIKAIFSKSGDPSIALIGSDVSTMVNQLSLLDLEDLNNYVYARMLKSWISYINLSQQYPTPPLPLRCRDESPQQLILICAMAVHIEKGPTNPLKKFQECMSSILSQHVLPKFIFIGWSADEDSRHAVKTCLENSRNLLKQRAAAAGGGSNIIDIYNTSKMSQFEHYMQISEHLDRLSVAGELKGGDVRLAFSDGDDLWDEVRILFMKNMIATSLLKTKPQCDDTSLLFPITTMTIPGVTVERPSEVPRSLALGECGISFDQGDLDKVQSSSFLHAKKLLDGEPFEYHQCCVSLKVFSTFFKMIQTNGASGVLRHSFCDLVFSQWIQAHGIQICDSKHLNSSGIVTPWCYLKRNDSNGMTFSAVNQDVEESPDNPDIKAVKKLLVLSIVDSLHLFTNLPSTSSSSGEQASPLNKYNLWRRMQLLRHRFKDVKNTFSEDISNTTSEDVSNLIGIGLIPPYKIPYLTYVETYDQVLKQLGISSSKDHPLNYMTKKVQLVGLTQMKVSMEPVVL
jgi:hypothetical protein